MLVLEAFGESLVENARFGTLLGLSLLVKVSWKKLVIVAFGESLVENARFESLDCHFW